MCNNDNETTNGVPTGALLKALYAQTIPCSTTVPTVPEEGDFGFEHLNLGPPTPPETLGVTEVRDS